MMKQFIRKFFPFHKVMSLDNRFYYIEEVIDENTKPDHRSTHGMGWLRIDTGEWYPFAFWSIKSGERIIATDEEVDRYRTAAGQRL